MSKLNFQTAIMLLLKKEQLQFETITLIEKVQEFLDLEQHPDGSDNKLKEMLAEIAESIKANSVTMTLNISMEDSYEIIIYYESYKLSIDYKK